MPGPDANEIAARWEGDRRADQSAPRWGQLLIRSGYSDTATIRQSYEDVTVQFDGPILVVTFRGGGKEIIYLAPGHRAQFDAGE